MNPVLGICSRLGYSSRSRTESQASSRIIFFILLFIVAVIIIFSLTIIIYVLLSKYKIELKDNFILATIASYLLPIASFLVSFDMVKEIVAAEIEALEKAKSDDINKLRSLNQELHSRNQELEQSSDSEVRQSQERYYMARAYVADEEIIDKRLRLEKITSPGYKKYYNSLEEAKDYFEQMYESREDRARLRTALVKISKESWIKLATEAAKAGLRPERVDAATLNNDPVKQLLFLDIYLYLSAWLVSSVDNDVASAIPYMPVEDIGLHYPNEQKPNLKIYEEAFRYLRKAFKSGLYVEIIQECQTVTPEEKDVCQKISEYMDELVLRLKVFSRSQSESQK
jgi:hypothetical protein